MSNNTRLVRNRHSMVVPLKTFPISMTEGQIKFLLNCIEHHERDFFFITQNGESSGLHMGGVDSIKSVLSQQLSELEDTRLLLREYHNWVS